MSKICADSFAVQNKNLQLIGLLSANRSADLYVLSHVMNILKPIFDPKTLSYKI